MDDAQWQRAPEIFLQATELEEEERDAFLRSACGTDVDLAREIHSMLAADSRKTSLLDRGLPSLAYEMVGHAGESVSAREFGPYKLVRVLGEGGMGVVWLAERSDAANRVAIKFLPHAALTPARSARFANEIRTLARLVHPYIARLYDAGALLDGTPWFVMEYVEGMPLTEYFRSLGPAVKEKLRVFRAVCQAVQYAHGQEIVHRDLKPSNVLIAKDGTPRLLDFGIARELHHLQQDSERTKPGLRFLSEPHTHAGYEVLKVQTSAQTSYMQGALHDLAAEYDALDRPVDADRFRAELAASNAPPPRTVAAK